MDLNLFREEKGGNPEIIRKSQRRRFANVEIVDDIIRLDRDWRKRQYELESLRKETNNIAKEVARLKMAAEKEDASDNMVKEVHKKKKLIAEKETEVKKVKDELFHKLNQVGNLVHDSVPVHSDEANNVVIRAWGKPKHSDSELKLKSHVELVELLGIIDSENGSKVAGGRGYYLTGAGVRLILGLVQYGIDFLASKGYTEVTTPCFMNQNVMAKCAQLAEFDEQLYKVTGGGDDKYLIATAEQPLCARHLNSWIHPLQLPKRYAGFSSCFRKEAGSHGKDTLGIFRTHQFEKVEQFCITSPNGNDSWEMLEEMLKNSEEFYQTLGLPYRTVAIVSGALNAAAAKKYDLEAWFPASNTFRELVSCSNCTDYQSRKLEIRYGHKTSNEPTKQYVHMLNCTLTAAQRTLCCILENYQKEDGVEIPEVIRPFMFGKTFLPFKSKPTHEAE